MVIKMVEDHYLKRRIEQAAEFLGMDHEKLEKALRGKSGAFDMYWNWRPNDVATVETKNYRAVVAHIETHAWSECGGGIEWEYATLIIARPKEGGAAKYDEVLRIVVRDAGDQIYDIENLWLYRGIHAEKIEGDTIEVCWKNPDGDCRECLKINVDDFYKGRMEGVYKRKRGRFLGPTTIEAKKEELSLRELE